MNFNQAKNLAEYHKYSKLELHNILKEALEKEKPEYWVKPNNVNVNFTNGHYFNLVQTWLRYNEGVNDSALVDVTIAGRILQTFSKYSKHLPPKKKKYAAEVLHHEKPVLKIKHEQ